VSQIETWSDKLAELAVFGANVQPGQLVAVNSFIGKEELTRKVARAAYRRGAKFVDVLYFDQWIKRERITLADERTLTTSRRGSASGSCTCRTSVRRESRSPGRTLPARSSASTRRERVATSSPTFRRAARSSTA
jgi:leucyl aminopeptidase (aminopeptidase T)